MILYLFGNVSRWKVQYSVKEYHNHSQTLSDNKKIMMLQIWNIKQNWTENKNHQGNECII